MAKAVIGDLTRLRLIVGRVMILVLWTHVPVVAGVAWFAGNPWHWPCLVATVAAGVATGAWARSPAANATRLTIAVALIARRCETRGEETQAPVRLYSRMLPELTIGTAARLSQSPRPGHRRTGGVARRARPAIRLAGVRGRGAAERIGT